MAQGRPNRPRARPFFSAGQKVVLFGGSFDPPHEGHRLVAKAALAKLQADFVWWLVSPQNPIKTRKASDDAARLSAVEKLARHPKFITGMEEKKLGTQYAIDTVRALKKAHPHVRFIWLIGADNLANLHKWKDWQGLMDELPFAVYPRPDYNLAALASPAARRFGGRILPAQESANLTRYGAPACVMLDGTHSAQSSTALRQKREAN